MRISDWSSDVCSSDLPIDEGNGLLAFRAPDVDRRGCANAAVAGERYARHGTEQMNDCDALPGGDFVLRDDGDGMSELRVRIFSARRGIDERFPLGRLPHSQRGRHSVKERRWRRV